jgi:hypothetical protein
MTVGAIPPEEESPFKRVPLRRRSYASSPSVEQPVAAAKRARGKQPASRWSRWIRLARIQTGWTAHRIVRLFRRRSKSPEAPRHDRSSVVKRAITAAIRCVNGHRKTAVAVGLVLFAAAIANWKAREPSPARPTVAKPVVVLDDVKVFPPPDGRKSLRGTGFQPVRETPRSDRAENANSGSDSSPRLGRVRNPSHGASAPMPATRRPVWLKGTIEEVDQSESRIRAAGHTELPFTSHPRGLADPPHVPVSRRAVQFRDGIPRR